MRREVPLNVQVMSALKNYIQISRRFGLRSHHELVLLGLLLSSAAFESFGIAMLLPIVEFIQASDNGDVLSEKSKFWQLLFQAYGIFSIPVNLATLTTTSFMCIVIRQIFAYYRQVYMQKLLHDLVRSTRNKMFSSYIQADFNYHDREASGGVVNSMTTELVMAIQTILAPIVILTYALMIVVYISLLLIITGPVTFGAAMVLCISALFVKRLIDKTGYAGSELATANQNFSQFLVQRIGSIRLIRLSNSEKFECMHLQKLTNEQKNHQVDISIFQARVSVLMEPIAIAIGFIVLYFGVTIFNLKIQEIAVFAILAVMRLLPTVKELLAARQSALGTRGSLFNLNKRYCSMLAAKETGGGSRKFKSLNKAIEFKNATFSYGKDRNITAIQNISIKFISGQLTALVGPSGAGKSTLIDCIPGLRKLTSGELLFDNVSISEFATSSLRRRIAYVSQSPNVFNVSVSEQIAYGINPRDQKKVEWAAQIAGAHQFIEKLPQGYDTLIGERGIKLSGGQLQRLDLARALMQEAPILIMDEPTSNLDAESEASFRKTLDNLRKKTESTIIVVAHRLSTIINADQIIVLKDGEIDAAGSHSNALAESEWYYKACQKQAIKPLAV